MSEWKEFKFGEIATVNMGQSPKSDTYNNEKIGLPFFQGNRTFGRLLPTVDTYCSSPIKIAEKNDILFSVRAPVGDINYSPEKVCIGRGLCSIRMKFGNQNFLFYLLSFVKQEIINKESGTVFGSVNKTILENLIVKVPDLPNQTAIAEILTSLDDKIELNNKINQELENLAQTLFKRWFVDFEFPNENGEPYKSSGGEMVDSELGEIPKGWGIRTLKDEFIINMGQSPKGDTYNDNGDGIIFFQGRSDFGFRFPSPRMYTSDPKKIAQKFETLISVRAPVGDINMAETQCCIGRGIGAISHSEKLFSYTYYKILSIQDELKSYDNEGTVFGSINKETLGNIKTIIPQKQIANDFNELVSEIDFLISNNIKEYRELTNLRDTLLPKLISGELEVQEVLTETT
jgi:type I restriction enzyme S subunit